MWKIENLFENPKIEASVKISEDFAEVTLMESSYSLARIVTSLGKVNPLRYQKIDVCVEKSNPDTDVKIYEIYYGEGRELLRQYVDRTRLSLVPEGADRLDVAVLVRGSSGDVVKISNPTVTELDGYKPRFVKIAAIDTTYAPPEGREKTLRDNLDSALSKIDEICKKENPDLVLLPEIFYTLGVTLKRPGEDYLRLDSPEIKSLCDMAKKHRIYLSFSFHETDDNGYYYNSSPLIDRDGKIVANYHKSHLTMKELASGITPGDEIVTYDADFGRIGFAICWDLFFPEFVSLAARDGVDIILNPTLGFHADQNAMRSKDTDAYVVSASTGGRTCAIMCPETRVPLIADGTENGYYAIAKIDLNHRFLVRALSAPSAAERCNVLKFEENYTILEKYR